MTAKIIDGKAIASELLDKIKEEVIARKNKGYSAPSLKLIRISFADFVNGNTTKAGTTFTLDESTNAGAITSLTDANFQDDSGLIFSLTYRI